jgi:hypothetical protein
MPSRRLLESLIHLQKEENFHEKKISPRISLSSSLPSVFCIIISLPVEVDNYRPSMSDYSCHATCSMAPNEIPPGPGDPTPPYTSSICQAYYRRHSCMRVMRDGKKEQKRKKEIEGSCSSSVKCVDDEERVGNSD